MASPWQGAVPSLEDRNSPCQGPVPSGKDRCEYKYIKIRDTIYDNDVHNRIKQLLGLASSPPNVFL